MPAGVPPEEVEDIDMGCYREGGRPNSSSGSYQVLSGLQGFLDGYTKTLEAEFSKE